MATNDIDSLLRLCKISICPPEETTDFDKLFRESTGMDGGVDSPERFVIEFGSQNSSINVNVGDTIHMDDIIGYMRGIPVKSKISGKITEVHEKYIIGEYDTDYEEILSSFDLSGNLSDIDIENEQSITNAER